MKDDDEKVIIHRQTKILDSAVFIRDHFRGITLVLPLFQMMPAWCKTFLMKMSLNLHLNYSNMRVKLISI